MPRTEERTDDSCPWIGEDATAADSGDSRGEPMLKVQGLVKLYGSRRVVDGVDFRGATAARSSACWVPTAPARRPASA